MSKLYLEIIEQKEENPKMIKLEVEDKKKADEKLLVEEPKFIGLNYIKRLHICNHDSGLPCEVKSL